MTPEREAELFATLGTIMALLQSQAADIAEMKMRLTRLEEEVVIIRTRLDGMDKRFDDQSRIMAALIPQRIAAVPPAA